MKQLNNPILQSVIKQVKDDISSILKQIEGITPEMITEALEKYTTPRIIDVQIYGPSFNRQIDVIVNDQIKIREDLWRSYEADRFVNQFMRGRYDE